VSSWPPWVSGTPSRGSSNGTGSGLDRLTAVDWRVVFVTAADLHRPELLIARLRVELG
jgi:hypothetical protein